MATTETTLEVVPGRWIVSLKANASKALQTRHLATVQHLTEDDTPFQCEVHQEYNELDEARAYCASFDDDTREQIEAMGDVCA
jgi:hypothetical protein